MIDCFASKNSFWIDPQGHIRPCARYKEKTNHISTFESFSSITNSESYIAIRNELERGVWPNGCVRCKEDEEKGLHSKRQFYKEVGLESPNDFMIDISMGNYCNLKCRMCGPHNSTLWARDFKFLVDQKLFQDPGTDLSAYQLSNADIEKLSNHIESIQGNIFLELKGGEPLIMPQTKLLINRLVNLKNSKKITLLVVTNGTVVPDWIEKITENFNKLQLVVSIDGINEVFDYIRGTEKFSYADCLKNIEYYHSLKNIDLRFNVVVQNLNIHQMLDVHQSLEKFNTTVNYITLSMPKFLEVNVMPKTSREMIYSNFISNADKFGNYKSLMQNIHNILLKDPDPKIYDTFKNITLSLDQRRNQDLKKVALHLLE